MDKIGIIVGNGSLPVQFLKRAESCELYPIGLFDTIDEKIKNHPNYKPFNIGEVGAIIKYLLKNDIHKIIMLGKVEKDLIFKDLELDEFGEKLLAKLPDRRDETLLFGVIAFMRLNGIKVLPQNYLLRDFMFEKKCYTKLIPSDIDLQTIKMGVKGAKMLSSLDAGQTVVCKNRSIVALEGIEGTDKTILRGGKLAGTNCIIVKMARPQQDMRVDIPAVGLDTIKKLIEIDARGIVGESNKMLFLDKSECIELANNHNMFIVGI